MCIRDSRNIHRNLRQEKNFNSHESFFRKSPFCTFSCINSGFGGPWDKLWKNFVIAIFIMLQKNVFGKKKFECHARNQKCHFGKIEKLPKWHFWTWAWNSKKNLNFAKMALLNLGMTFENFFGQNHSFEALWKWQQEKIFTTCPRVRQIQDLCRKKYKKGIF